MSVLCRQRVGITLSLPKLSSVYPRTYYEPLYKQPPPVPSFCYPASGYGFSLGSLQLVDIARHQAAPGSNFWHSWEGTELIKSSDETRYPATPIAFI
ncbi:hypothetical protein WG66_007317 [Moniliophthora roreri]|nr:hypothetical protein WG66_007317 [Moniliophthora roreri]